MLLPHAALFAALLLVRCSGADVGGGLVPDAGRGSGTLPDTSGQGGLDGGGDGSDPGTPPPIDDIDTRPPPGPADGDGLGLGEICEEDNVCASDLCFFFDPTIDEGFCSQLCAQTEDCNGGEGWRCVFLANSGRDFVRICAPNNLCIDRDGDGYGAGPGCSGPDCDDTNAEVYPGAPETCDGIDNNCDGNVDTNTVDANVDCDTGFPGVCQAGRVQCLNGVPLCIADRNGQPEICDGIDNDCDGQVDEGEDGQPLRQTCYGGPAGTVGVGACREGVRLCEGGIISDCLGQVLPQVEVCDGVDNDCDGEVDEGSPGAGQPCDVPGQTGPCSRGRTQCDASGALICAQIVFPTVEICDGIDNDCDGGVDENEDGGPLQRSCFGGSAEQRGVGACTDGTQTCLSADWGACGGQVLPAPELCDGIDNNCNGETDEGDASGGFVCSTGQLGVCALGTTFCTDEGSVCRPNNTESPEVCDGLDNDCDGQVDEGEDGLPLRRDCYGGPGGTEGIGLCRGGSQTCGPEGFGICVGEVRPTMEVCDGVDNDCDGAIDEGNPGGGVVCTTGLAGVCARGITACSAGTIQCTGAPTPSEEICDGLDNDCDGLTDEGADGLALRRDCYGGPAGTQGVGLCRGGVQTCGPEGFGFCAGEVRPTLEVCDGVDNDCDGAVDEGNPGGGVVCSTGLAGVCSQGITACQGGRVQCTGAPAPSAEVCDGFDNDCDGQTDEDEAGRPLTLSCYDGPAGTAGRGVCTAGVRTCSGGGFGGCVGQVLPGTEICNGVDDDCDGVLDNGNPGGGISCNTGLPGVCASGTTACQGGSVRCAGAIAPGTQAEICDGLDNNCNGTVDEGFPGLGTGCTAGLGICARPGVVVCAANRTSAPVCNATPGTGNPVEQCDYVDDNCNGQVDEGFVDGSGRYTTVAHCGACGSDCNLRWPGGPALYNVIPSCAPSGATALCGFTCAAGFVNADGVADNGCEFQPEPQTVYVSTPANLGSDVSTCGAWNAPCASIQFAIGRAQATSRNRVRVSTGLYRENITLANGISVLGGHSNINWTRNPSLFATTLRGVDAASAFGSAADRIVVAASAITVATEFSGFIVNGVNAGPGGNSIGIFVTNSGNALTLRDNEIAAGAGGNGTTGAAGATGLNGTAGGAGQNSAWLFAPSSSARVGGPGGARTCGATVVSGGKGGDGVAPFFDYSRNPPIPSLSGPGAAGSGPLPGAGGTAGIHMGGNGGATGTGGSCFIAGPIDAQAGRTGNAGTDGAGGAGAGNAAGTVSGNRWQGVAGNAGVSGGPGSGGGGGGSPGGIFPADTTNDQFPAAGGGGGSGGCQGNGGSGGSAGGASFALLIRYDSARTAVSQLPILTGNRLRRGLGGRGGDGGTGGGGGDGGNPGLGGVAVRSNPYNFCLVDAAAGGPGGRGGHGGGGGGGAGGISFDIYVWNSGGFAAGYTSANTFEIPAGTPTGGSGGLGGNSSNTAVGLGGAGVTGISGTLGTGP
jgi:hypothetical protein